MISFWVRFHWPASPATASLRQSVQAQNRRRLDADLLVVGVDPAQRPAVPYYLDLRPVAGPRLAEHEGSQAIPIDGHAFDAIRGFRALDQRHLAERFQYLW